MFQKTFRNFQDPILNIFGFMRVFRAPDEQFDKLNCCIRLEPSGKTEMIPNSPVTKSILEKTAS